MTAPRAYPHAVGDRVTLDGVTRTVTARPGPYSVTLDGYLTASTTSGQLAPAARAEVPATDNFPLYDPATGEWQ